MITCPECGVTLYSSDTPENVLRNHKAEAHGMGAQQKLTCPHCNQDAYLSSDGKALLSAPRARFAPAVTAEQSPAPYVAGTQATGQRGQGVTSKIG